MGGVAEILSIEHEVILQKLAEFKQALAFGDVASLRGFVRFFREDMDFHGRKEEEVLYPLLAAFSSPNRGLVAILMEDHIQLGDLVEGLAQALDVNDPGAVDRYGAGILGILPEHIRKEEVLFPVADQVLDERALGRVREEFEAIGSWI